MKPDEVCVPLYNGSNQYILYRKWPPPTYILYIQQKSAWLLKIRPLCFFLLYCSCFHWQRQTHCVSQSLQWLTMGAIASQITSLTIVYSTIYSDADQRKHQSSASLAFVCGIHRWPVNSPHKWPVMRKIFPFDDVIMILGMFRNINDYKYNFVNLTPFE